MNKKELKLKIDELGPWYQSITLDGIQTLRKRDTQQAWKRIEENFSINYQEARILDLGCNSGYYSIMAARNGATVIGIEVSDKAINQANFLKNYYEELWNTKLDITFINKDLSDIDFLNFEMFDCIFALSILYHIGRSKYGKGSLKSFKEQDRIISQLTKITDKFIIRARDRRKRPDGQYYNPQYYNKVFNKFNFKPTKIVNSGRSLISYERL